ncbi:MAG: CRISPR-associated endonuclease Cas9 [Verrucomicrobiota bacterium]|jgi:5-methylcytosine-specific restriction endonuclease McrA
MQAKESVNRWDQHDFYQSALVLGLDIGIEGIGVWLRCGRECLWARTYETATPESAPLRDRRLKRSARRARQSEKHREVLLKRFCTRFDLPWAAINSNPFKLRLRAITKQLASKQALVICLRHIIRHRGYDYHLTNEGNYPWGDELNLSQAVAWAQSSCCNPALAEKLRYDLANSGLSSEKLAGFSAALAKAEDEYAKQPIPTMLEAHFGEKPHLRPPARQHNFPRELVWAHLEDICRRHPQFFGGETRLNQALPQLKGILDYHRKEPGALAERKVKTCPYAPLLFDGQKLRCDVNTELPIRQFKLLEFLASRSFVSEAGHRLPVTAPLFDWLAETLAKDAAAVTAKLPRPATKDLRKEFAKLAGVKLASDKLSHNGDFFEQLKDLLSPKLSVLKARASLSAKAAQRLCEVALTDGFQPECIQHHLQSYYQWRIDSLRGYGVYPQVEFLLGRRSKSGKQAVPGKLRQILARPEIQARLGDKTVPDYVVVECVGDIPRHRLDKLEIQAEQKSKRAFKEALFAKHHIEGKATDSDRKRVLLFDQQGGSRGEANCPYTGKSLGENPLSPKLQIDHIYPRELGGISEMVNLVLTHTETNLAKGKRTPWQAYSASWDAVLAHLGKMQWNKGKKALFQRQETDCPDWKNMTRMSQLARQLKDEVAHWLDIKGQPLELARRIGTPSGFLTSVCRQSWRDKLPDKNRANQRHHLWDAAVIAHIPPGPGLNHTHYGGIFYQERGEEPGQIAWRAVPDLGPDVLAFEQAHAADCLVEKHRQRKSKAARAEETIYGMDAEGQLWSRKEIFKDGAPVKGAEQMLEHAGFPTTPKDQLPRKLMEHWLTGHQGKPLRLANKTEVRRVPVAAGEESPTALVPHKNHTGEIIGYKKAKETYWRCEIWLAPDKDKKGRPVYQRRLIPHPRGLVALRKRGLSWKHKAEGATESLRQQVCGKLAPFSKKVGSFAKGDLVRLPLDANGDICLPPATPFCWLWYRVSATSSDGKVEMKLVEFKDKSATPLPECEKDILIQKPSSPSVLASLLQLKALHGQPSHPHH